MFDESEAAHTQKSEAELVAKRVAVLIHYIVLIAAKFVAQVCNNSAHIFRSSFVFAHHDGLAKFRVCNNNARYLSKMNRDAVQEKSITWR